VLARLRWSAFGLRGRIVSAVLITTVVTLGIAALVLLPQLESELRTASEGTLKTDVTAAAKEGDISKIGAIDYRLIAERDIAALRQTTDFALARHADLGLRQAVTTLQGRLGATNVTLIGYIDPSGAGKPVIPEAEPDTDIDTAAAAAGSLSDVASAFASGKIRYSFGSVNNREVVRAAIPLGNDAVLAVRKSIDEIPAAVTAVRSAFEIAAMAGLLMTILVAIPLAATLVRRLQRLREAALRLAVEGTGPDFPVDRARDEVGDLARSFGIMSRRLRQQEQARRAFVATASHELRTPLASLDGMLELLADDLQGPEPDLPDANTLLERARAQSRRLGRLAADLLDLSRIDADVALRSEPVELAELSRAVEAEFELAMADRGVTAVQRSDSTQVWAQGDPGSIARILRILLDNALRVAPRGSDITIELAAEPSPTLRVGDAGPGILADERELIFDRFQRGRDTGGEAGFGLGLAIGRELAGRMGGTLELTDAPSPGATFTLALPAVPAPPTAPRQQVAEHQT
jgi:signal transduction histidine kinase